MENRDREQMPLDFYLVTEEMGRQNREERGPVNYYPSSINEDQEEEALNDWVEETMVNFPFVESERYSERKAYKAVIRHAWQTPAREIIEGIILRSKLLPNRTADLSLYLRECHRTYSALFEEATGGEPERMEWYMFTRTRQTIAEAILCDVWPHWCGPFDDMDTIWQHLVSNKSYVHPDSAIWTWEEFWDAVGNKGDEEVKILGYYVVIRWLQRQIFMHERAFTTAYSSVSSTVGAATNRSPFALFKKIASAPKQSSGFDTFIRQEKRGCLMPLLESEYTDSKPMGFALMVIALSDLELLNQSVSTINQTELHQALTATFGAVGTRQALQQNMAKINNADRGTEAKLFQHKERLRVILRPGNQ